MTKVLGQNELYETIATLFAVTVLVDKRERAPEMVEFTHACTFHNLTLRPNILVTPEGILKWYEDIRPAIKEALETRGDAYKVSLLSKITDPELRRTVLSSMFTISVSDHEFHASENALIKVALATWDAEPPTAEEIDKVA